MNHPLACDINTLGGENEQPNTRNTELKDSREIIDQKSSTNDWENDKHEPTYGVKNQWWLCGTVTMSNELNPDGVLRRTLLKAGAVIAGALGMLPSATASGRKKETQTDETIPSESAQSQKGYLIAVEGITDRERYMNEYFPVAAETTAAHDGEALVFSFDPTMLDGEWGHDLTIVLEFPSVQAAKEWYADDALQEVRQIRHETTAYSNKIVTSQYTPEDRA